MSRPCATFANPDPLLSSPTPTLAVVEVWLLQPLETEDDEDGVPGQHTNKMGGGTGSVLNTRAADQHFMKLAGVALDSSAAYRNRVEPPIEED